MLHTVFRPSCIQNHLRFAFFSHARKSDMPITKYRIVQTGPNIQEGGLKNGLLRVVYQVFTELIVKIEPSIPAPSHITIAAKNFQNLFTTSWSQMG